MKKNDSIIHEMNHEKNDFIEHQTDNHHYQFLTE